MKGYHPHSQRQRHKDILITAVVVTLVFCVVLYLQAILYGRCESQLPTGVKTIHDLHAYLLRFSSSHDNQEDVKHILNVHESLGAILQNNTRLAKSQQDLLAATEKLTRTQQELAAATDSLKKLESQLKECQSVKDQVKSLESKVDQHSKELSGAQQQVQQLTQQKEQLEKDKQELQQKAQQLESIAKEGKQGQPTAIAVNSTADVQAKLQALAVAGDQCGLVQDYEFWANPILIWGYDHRAADAAECCAACHAHRRVVARGGTEEGRNSSSCNIWAFCGSKELCKERYGECWLKHEAKLPAPPKLPPDAHQAPGWVSGAVYENDTELQPYHNKDLVFHTRLGDIGVELLPELAPASVRELRRMAALLARINGYCSNCRIYRPEKNFLVQGIIEAPGAYVATPRRPNPPQKMMMERGLVCWAGGGGGPHWFVNMVNQTGFKDDHLCFGKVSEHDMAVFEKILELPVKEKKNPNDMNGLVENVSFNITFKDLGKDGSSSSSSSSSSAPAGKPASSQAVEDKSAGSTGEQGTPAAAGDAAPVPAETGA